jgi:ParB/RepB/Spo0J family partition protein
LVPVIVEPEHTGKLRYLVVDGRRRRAAAKMIERNNGVIFPLQCLVRAAREDTLQAAIHANLKRRGYTPLQFAYLVKDLRAKFGWTGTKEVSEYLGVSRAQISQHDKLLRKPDGMPDTTYAQLCDKLATGRMGADAAFYALTNVMPEKLEAVLEQVTRETSCELAKTTLSNGRTEGKTGTKGENELEPRGQKGGRVPAPPTRKNESTQPERLESANAKPPKRVEKRQIEAVARQLNATNKPEPSVRTLNDARLLLLQMAHASYPDLMRHFAAEFANSWLSCNCDDKAILNLWSQISVLVEESSPKKSTAAKLKLKKR